MVSRTQHLYSHTSALTPARWPVHLPCSPVLAFFHFCTDPQPFAACSHCRDLSSAARMLLPWPLCAAPIGAPLAVPGSARRQRSTGWPHACLATRKHCTQPVHVQRQQHQSILTAGMQAVLRASCSNTWVSSPPALAVSRGVRPQGHQYAAPLA